MSKKKFIFVTFNGIHDAAFGGAKASVRNYRSLTKYGEVLPYEIKKRSNLKSILSIIQGNMPPLLNNDIRKIKRIIKEQNIDICFLDSSTLGNISNQINIPIIAFFHNCEKDYNSVRFGKEKSFKKSVYQKTVDKAEFLTINNADRICVFNQRDSNRLKVVYGRSADFIIPLSISDTFKRNLPQEESIKNEKTVLLFGPSGTANDEAFTWFVKNVSPNLHCNTLIAGKGMDRLKELESNTVKVIGYVDSLQDLYDSVDCVAIPLLSGGGMKIKTAEALMYGKFIFGTKEAFVGYEDVITREFSSLCNDADSFIKNINNYMDQDHKTFYSEARETYLNYFSPEATQAKFDELIESLI